LQEIRGSAEKIIFERSEKFQLMNKQGDVKELG